MNSNLLMNKTECLLNLTFGLSWITDTEMREHIKEHFFLQELVYPNVNMQAYLMQGKANDIADYYNKMYVTTQYQYNPLYNVDGTETWTETVKGKSKTNTESETNNLEFPMNSTDGKQTDKGTGSGVSDSENESTVTHHLAKAGNIGVTMTQQLIEAERRVILNMIEKYVAEYDDFFMITM